MKHRSAYAEWTDAEEAFLTEAWGAEKLSRIIATEMAERFGTLRTASAVVAHAKYVGLPNRHKKLEWSAAQLTIVERGVRCRAAPLRIFCVLSRRYGLFPSKSALRYQMIKAQAGLASGKYAQRYEPSKQEWIAAATLAAQEGRVSPSDVMAGVIRPNITAARWRAWKALLEANPKLSVAGVARVSGFDHSSLLHSFRKTGYPISPQSSAHVVVTEILPASPL